MRNNGRKERTNERSQAQNGPSASCFSSLVGCFRLCRCLSSWVCFCFALSLAIQREQESKKKAGKKQRVGTDS
jgi:hypothetical protein